MKSISIINPAITENTECSIVKMHVPVINLEVGVLLKVSVLLGCINLLTSFEVVGAIGYC